MPFHILLDSSFLLRLPISVVAHLETFSGVLFWQKSKPWLCIHISLPHQSSLMYATWCRQRHNLALRISSKQQHEESLSPSSSPFFLHLFIFFFFFFLIHVQQVPSVPSHVPRSFPMSAVELKRDFLNLIDQVVTNLAGSHSLDIHQIATTECRCWVSSVL